MRKTVFLLASLFVMVLATQRVNAQNPATAKANATATIITPIAIAHVADLSFGKIPAAQGEVTISPDGVRTTTGDILPSPSEGEVHAAQFTVTGLANATYAITLPGNNEVTIKGPGEPMTVTKFTSNPSGTGTLTGGTQTLSVGAMLTVGANQTAGAYTGEFSVKVAYN